jgi:hypothetical protein
MSASYNDTKAMEAILANLSKKTEEQTAAAAAHPSTDERVKSIGDPNARAMADILSKLESATESNTVALNEASEQNIDLKMAMGTERNATGVSIADYEIIVEKQTVGRIIKNFYTIQEKATGTNLHTDLGLFETAMSVVKRLMLNKGTHVISRIIEADSQYTGALLESYDYKRRLASDKLTESKEDIYQAKYDSANEKMRIAKSKILKTL